MIECREDIPAMLLDGIGVEVGVQRGIFSECILRRSKLRVLYSVDTWATKIAGEKEYLEARQRLEQFGTRSVMLRTTSLEAAKSFVVNTLDFVYIDADHSYESVRDDMAAWWPKVRGGGILAGHDYDSHTPGVIRAVDEFQASVELTKCDRMYRDVPIRSWIFHK